jgi:hypothetical protein
VITKCHVCGGSLIYWNRGKRTKPMHYCSTKIHRGTCSNGAGIPIDALDYAVKVKLMDLLDKDFDRVLDLCEEQAQVWREKAAMPTDQRALATRQILRKIGVTSIVVRPVGHQAWEFVGQTDFRGVVHSRSSEGPPKPPGARKRPGAAVALLDLAARSRGP